MLLECSNYTGVSALLYRQVILVSTNLTDVAPNNDILL